MPHFSFHRTAKDDTKMISGDGRRNGVGRFNADTSTSSFGSDDQKTSKGTSQPDAYVENGLDDDSVVETSDASIRSGSPVGSSLRLLKSNSSEQGLWRQAWDEIPDDVLKMLPPGFEAIDTLDVRSQVVQVHQLAEERAKDTMINERKILYTNKTYREVYGKVASCASKFQIVGDMVSQSEPVYAALPWTLIKFAIQCAVGEDETYHTMLSGTELVSDLVTQYSALEQLYARIDSEMSKKFRKFLVSFYKTILHFQITAIKYFDPHHKGTARFAKGINPITADGIKSLRQGIDKSKKQVDDAAILVSFEVAKLGIDNLKAGQKDQEQEVEAIKDGIKVLAGHTGQAFRDLSREQQELQKQRNDTLVAMWKEPLDHLMESLENQELEKQRRNLHGIRKWLSVAMPKEDRKAAGNKRFMSLGDWLIRHDNFQHWETLGKSTILWLYECCPNA